MNQISKVTGIKLKGRMFSNLSTLQLLSYGNGEHQNSSRVALVYGKNGSGKTTISRAFLQAAGKEQVLEEASFLDKTGTEINLEEENDSVYVFNEDYINSNIRVKKYGLQSIVILGEQTKVDDNIDKIIEEEKEPLENQIAKDQKMLQEMNDSNNSKSALFYSKLIENKLKGDESWAGIKREIKGQKNNSRVTEIEWKKIAKLQPTEPIRKLRSDLSTGLRKLQNIRENAHNNDIKEISLTSIDKLREKVIETQELLGKEISESLQDNKQFMQEAIKSTIKDQNLHQTIEYFSNPNHKYCPFCLQKVTNDYADILIKSIQNSLNDEVKKHEEKLTNLRVEELKIDFSNSEQINPLAAKDCEKSLLLFNKEIDYINKRIEDKLRRPFVAISYSMERFNTIFYNFREYVNKLNKSISEFKEQTAQITEFKNKLLRINDQVASIEIQDYYSTYTKKIIEKNKLEKMVSDRSTRLSQVKERIEQLEEKKKSIVIAVSEINEALQYIFFSKNRLSIEVQGDNYVLYSRGNPVLPGNTSVGERNAIALCYFFTSLLKGKNKNEAYSKPCIIVIDDPISSFDMENKVGVISYLRYELEKFLQTLQTKVIVFTHDLQVFFDMEKVFSELLPSKKKSSILKFCLNNKGLKESGTTNEYSTMLNDVYNYASGVGGVSENAVGNEMRRVLEAYSTFLYREGIESVSTKEEILECMTDCEQKYFKNRMYRLVLHGESHSEEKIKTIDDLNFSQRRL